MESRHICFPINVLAFIWMFGCSFAWNREYYTAAVYEHCRQGDNITNDSATVIETNLRYYSRATRAAKEQGADVIVFPEYGIFPPLNRKELKNYLEFIPNPKEVRVIPCDEPELFKDRPIMYSLSCMAKMNEILIVANMGSIEKCVNETRCPEDGELHFNANVAFDKNGTLLARYYKERLYFEFGMNLPREKQDPIFDTELGKFATFICFDSIFEKMAIVSQEVDAILYSAMWVNSSPFFTSTQWWQAWGIGNNATILASNIQMPGYFATGSGIFRGEKGSIAYTLNPDGVSKLVVARVPKSNGHISSSSKIIEVLENGTKEWKDDGKDVPEICTYGLLGPSQNIYKDYRCYNENFANYTLIKLHKAKDHLEACNNHMCCEIDYVADSMDESYYLGVYNGSNKPYERYYWWEENCFLARCDDLNGTACSIFPMMSNTLFYKISMTANFTSKRIYPSFVSNRSRLVPVENWTFDKKPDWSSITMNSHSGIPIIAATLKGRAYEKDPPYIR